MLKSAFKCILQTTYSPLWRFHISHQTCNCNHANELMTTSFVLLTSKLWIFTQNSYRSCEALNDIPDSLTLVCNMMISKVNQSLQKVWSGAGNRVWWFSSADGVFLVFLDPQMFKFRFPRHIRVRIDFDFRLVTPPKALNTKWTTWQDVNSKSFLSSLWCSEGGINKWFVSVCFCSGRCIRISSRSNRLPPIHGFDATLCEPVAFERESKVHQKDF